MKSQFRQLVDSFPDAVVLVDGAGRIQQANAQAASLFGYGRDQLAGTSVQMLLPDQPLPLLPAGQRRPGEQAGRHVDLVGSRRDGTQFPADVCVIPIQTRHGPVAVLTFRDLTENQRARFVLELGLEVLESADRDHQALLGYLVRAQEEERGRIAADVHDDTVQLISAASLRLQQLRHRLRNPGELRLLDKAEETLKLALSHLRQLIFDLRPSRLEEGSLAAALRGLLEQLRAETGTAYRLDDSLAVTAPAETLVLIYRIAQEALANVRNHARAKTVEVQLLGIDDGCLVRIADDGIGYNPSDIEHRPGHLGLVLMRERAHIAGGWCRIESAPGAGTTVEFWVPIGGPSARSATASGHADVPLTRRPVS